MRKMINVRTNEISYFDEEEIKKGTKLVNKYKICTETENVDELMKYEWSN